MRRVKITLIILGVLCALVVIAFPVSSYRYRVTLNVDTPEGLKSSSSVMQVIVSRNPAWIDLRSGPPRAHPSLKADAIFVDLGLAKDGTTRNLIALLAWGDLGTGPLRAG